MNSPKGKAYETYDYFSIAISSNIIILSESISITPNQAGAT